VQHTRASAEFLVISFEGFSFLANGRHGIGIPALTHSVYCTFFATYSTRLPKNDGGVEMMMTTTMMSEKFWTEAEAEAETAGIGVGLSLPSQYLS
jgi:hypothetical protein